MSVDLHLRAFIRIRLPSGNILEHEEEFFLWETPSGVSIRIDNSNTPEKAYRIWVLKTPDRKYYQETPSKHLSELTKWLAARPPTDGWKIKWSAW